MISFKPHLLFSLLISFLISSDYRFDINEKELFLDSQFQKLTNEFKIKAKQNNNSSNYYSARNKVKNAAYSLLIPGLGQYKNGNKQRAFIYMGLEIFGWASYFTYDNKFDEEKSSYQNYASYDLKNWRFAHWIGMYDNFNDDEDWNHMWQGPDGDGGLVWKDIGAQSHYIEFSWCPSSGICENVRTNDDCFRFSCNGDDAIIDILIASPDDVYSVYNLEIIRDHHFYENIGKYNEFFMGWVDSIDPNSIWQESSGNGYIYPMSNKKRDYLDSYNKAEDYADYSEYAINIIFLNHVVSMIDAFFSTNSISVSSELIYDNVNYGYPSGYNCTLGIRL